MLTIGSLMAMSTETLRVERAGHMSVSKVVDDAYARFDADKNNALDSKEFYNLLKSQENGIS